MPYTHYLASSVCTFARKMNSTEVQNPRRKLDDMFIIIGFNR